MKDFILLDIETTGFNQVKDEITEIAAIRVCGDTFKILDRFESLVKINGIIPMRVMQITGITKSLTEKRGVEIKSVLNQLSNFSGSLEIYAHNASFDKKFIKYNLEKYGIDFVETEWIDTIKKFKELNPNHQSYSLGKLIEYYGLSSKNSHRAMHDTINTLEIYKILRNIS